MSGNKLVLDTNIVLYLLSGDSTVVKFLQDAQVFVSTVTELELIGYPSITEPELAQIQMFLHDCTVIDVNSGIKEIYIGLRRQYRLKLGDAIAAATAIFLDLPFMSADKDFQKVNELNFMLYSK